MKRIRAFIFLFVFVCLVFSPALHSQTGDGTHFDMSEFPQWAKDLRRGEIIAFGTYPFSYIISNFAVDIYRSAIRGGDRRYAPWPLRTNPSVGKTQGEVFMTIGVAAGVSVLFALVDYTIMRVRRSRQAKEIRIIQEENPVIILRSELPETVEAAETESTDIDAEAQ